MTKPDLLVMKVVERIAKSLRPDKIILLGSRAKGTAGPESDIDLLIIYSGPRSKREVQVAIHQLFEHPDFSLDVFVLTLAWIPMQGSSVNKICSQCLNFSCLFKMF
jgi:predicted nucleotidyltransferase